MTTRNSENSVGNMAHKGHSPYLMLALNLLLSGVVMYFVMFTMIDGLSSFYHNFNMAYMAIMMVAPMGILMVVIMRSMFTQGRTNVLVIVGFTLLFALAFVFMRQQTAVGDTQFLRSMIPHHSGAILMCSEANITDREIQKLCEQIVKSQREEIQQMQRILQERHP